MRGSKNRILATKEYLEHEPQFKQGKFGGKPLHYPRLKSTRSPYMMVPRICTGCLSLTSLTSCTFSSTRIQRGRYRQDDVLIHESFPNRFYRSSFAQSTFFVIVANIALVGHIINPLQPNNWIRFYESQWYIGSESLKCIPALLSCPRYLNYSICKKALAGFWKIRVTPMLEE